MQGTQLNSDRIGRWLALGANFGVLVGLILLIVEIQQNTDMIRAEMSQARTDNRVESFYSRALSDHWPRIIASQNEYTDRADWYDSMSDEDYERVRFFYLGVINEMGNSAYQCSEGYLHDQVCESMRAQLIRILPDLPYVTFNLESGRGPLFEVLQELGREDTSLPLLMNDGSWSMPASGQEEPFGRRMGRQKPRVSGTREDPPRQ